MSSTTCCVARFALAAIAAIVTAACSGAKPQTLLPGANPPLPLPALAPMPPGAEKETFDRFLASHPNLTADQVLAMIPQRKYLEQLPFDPATAKYFPEVSSALSLTDQEKGILRKQGFVSVDHRQHFSMGSVYYAIYARDLPVLVTTDSIAHALHRSYDTTLKHLEYVLFTSIITKVLESSHELLAKEASGISDPKLMASVHDVDLYLSVARSLLAGMGAPSGTGQPTTFDGPVSAPHLVASRFGQDSQVRDLLDRIRSLELEKPDGKKTEIYGGKRAIDWSQFRPRGHYTEMEELRRYFRTMMWLGRSDLGWNLLPSTPVSGVEADTDRERRSAALLSFILEKSGQFPRLQSMSSIIDFMVGHGDSLSTTEMRTVLPSIKAEKLADFADPAVAQRLELAVTQLGLGRQNIRSQTLGSNPNDTAKTPPPQIFQVFGQRFVIDSFVLSELVFDSIIYQEKKQERMMPTGLDVFAAMGNNEAVRLLEPELRRWNYGSNLMAARAVVDSYSAATWGGTVANGWVDALRRLDDELPAQAPQAMQTRAWQHKQLQTQLASWAEMRRDMILYVKQSYSVYPACSYPTGYVEPYPGFFQGIAGVGRNTARLIGSVDTSDSAPEKAKRLSEMRQEMVSFWTDFANTVAQLQQLAQKELAGQPFTSEEQAFVKKTIDMRGGGSGPPRYDGWYPKLIFGGEPQQWKPTVADVHTDPQSGKVLEVGVGDVTFLVAAIDNQGDKAIYVGPMSSYYEFHQASDKRMTDEEWEVKASAFELPPKPTWTMSFQPQLQTPSKARQIAH